MKTGPIQIELSVSYRHRWLGLSFAWLASLPTALGARYSDRTENAIARTTYALMGARVLAR